MNFIHNVAGVLLKRTKQEESEIGNGYVKTG